MSCQTGRDLRRKSETEAKGIVHDSKKHTDTAASASADEGLKETLWEYPPQAGLFKFRDMW